MTRLVESAAWLFVLLALLLLAVRLRAMFRRAPSSRCPGPTLSLRHLINPWWWFLRPACGYDLSGLPADTREGSRPDRVRCPECGTLHPPKALRRVPRRFGWARAAMVCLALALACSQVRWLRSGCWAPHVPTPLLLSLIHLTPAYAPAKVRRELVDRVTAHRVGSLWKPWLHHLAVREMRDDAIDWNAEWGFDILREALPESLPALHAALDDPDLQCRQAAGFLLMGVILDEPSRHGHEDHVAPGRLPKDYTPPDSLLRVAVEALKDDRLGYLGSISFANAQTAAPFLRTRIVAATAHLEEALRSTDWQQNLLASAVLAAGHHPTLATRAAEVLCTHRPDNFAAHDATLASIALWKMGPDALPTLERYYDSVAPEDPDSQAALTAELLIRKLRGEPLPRRTLRRLNVIKGNIFDPTESADDFYGLESR